jgi:hypothetical protein
MKKARKMIVATMTVLGCVFVALPAALACGPYGGFNAVEADLASFELRTAIAELTMAYARSDFEAASAAAERVEDATAWVAFTQDQLKFEETRLAERSD